MTVLIVAIQNDLSSYFRSADSSASWNVVQYRHPLKALDNIGELEPDIILWSHGDFPRHWGTFIGAMRNQEKRGRFYLVSEKVFTEAELTKIQTLALEGYCHEGFYADEVLHFVRKYQTASARFTLQEQFIPLADSRGMLIQDKNGAFPVKDLELGNNEIKVTLAEAEYTTLPVLHTAAELIVIHGSSRERILVQIKSLVLNTLQLLVIGQYDVYAKILKASQRR